MSKERSSLVYWAVPTLLLLLLFGLLVFSIEAKSPTADEQNHLARGLAYLQTGDLRLSQEHPPGVNAWTAWPLLLDPRVELPLESESWANAEWYGFADRLLWWRNGEMRAPGHSQQMITSTRVPVMWLTLLLAAIVYRWAHALGGQWASGIALVLLAFDPNLLAHGRLTTTDVGVTCTTVAAMYALWRTLLPPPRARYGGGRGGALDWAIAGAALGAALLSKFSALSLVPVTLSILIVAWIARSRNTEDGPRWRVGSFLLSAALLYGVAALVVWAGYAFTWGPIAALNGLPGPAPAFWSGIQSILRRTGAGSPAFLLGQISDEGWWYYFIVAFGVKTPLPVLGVLGVGAGVGIWKLGPTKVGRGLGIGAQRGQEARTHAGYICVESILCLALPPLAFWAMAIAGSFNIGYRHILPSLPFLYILAAWSLGTLLTERRRPSQSANPQSPSDLGRPQSPIPNFLISLLLLWLALETLLIAPHYLAYFNQIVGGPEQGYRVLVDSNLDWGQDLPGLKRYVEEAGIERVYLSWFGAAYPEAYELSFHPLPGFWRFGGEAAAFGYNPLAPAPGVYAISATNLQGVKLDDPDLYAWFREREPDDQVGYSIQIYRVAGAPDRAGTAVLGLPLAQLAAEERAALRGVDSVRQYDPRTGLIVPESGEAWYVTPLPPEGSQVVREGPGYVVAQVQKAAVPAVLRLQPVEGATFGGFVRPLAAQVGGLSDASGETLTVTVHWRVEHPPHRAAISFAHLLDAQGAYVAGWDGLTAPATCWQEGDWIEQQYPIVLPPDLPSGRTSIEVGWYDAETGERWAFEVGDQALGDRWLLEDWEDPS